MPYITKEYVIENTQHNVVKMFIEENEERFNNILYEAEKHIERFAGQKFEPIAETKAILSGSGNSILQIPFKIDYITNIIIDGLPRQYYKYNHYDVELITIPSQNTIVQSVFGIGYNNVEIEGLFGWETIPQIIKIVCRKIVEFLILSDADEQSQMAFYSPYKSLTADQENFSMKDDYNYKIKILTSLLEPINNKEYKTSFSSWATLDDKEVPKARKWGIDVV